MAEGARLLSECRFTLTEGSNPSLSAKAGRPLGCPALLFLFSGLVGEFVGMMSLTVDQEELT